MFLRFKFKSIPWLSCALVVASILGGGCGESSSPPAPTVSLADKLARALKISDPKARADNLLRLVNELLAAADQPAADRALTAIKEIIPKVDDPVEQARLWADLAERQARASQKGAARESLLLAKSGQEKLAANPFGRVRVLTRMAYAHAALGAQNTVADTLATAEGLAKGLTDPEELTRAWLELARARHFLDQHGPRDEAYTAARTAAMSAPEARLKCELLLDIADAQLKVKQIEPAQQLLGEARRLAGEIVEPLSRGYVLLKLAEKYSLAGLADDSVQLFAQVEGLIKQIPERDLQKELSDKLAETKKKYGGK
ncbi:MAG: hypothetical protein SFX18_08030 [Pirellulales bacterium]|nr:hypothetical protein [Pirellulales bacterium]